jgi:DNA invertase Pin-like site-specific DNA recombinase
MPRAFSYVRMSTGPQLKGDSLRRQLELSRDFASQHALELDEGLKDIGISAFRGTNREKGALAAFLDLIRAGKIEEGSYLLVESLDRLSREQVRDAMKLFLEIVDAGVVLVTMCDGQIYSRQTIDSDFTRLIISLTVMARAHEESRQKSHRLRAVWQHKQGLASQQKVTSICP